MSQYKTTLHPMAETPMERLVQVAQQSSEPPGGVRSNTKDGDLNTRKMKGKHEGNRNIYIYIIIAYNG